MQNTLENIFQDKIPIVFRFLVTEYNHELVQEDACRFISKSRECYVVMELEKGHFGCWIERRLKGEAIKAMSVDLIAKCKGYRDEQRFYSSREEALLGEMDLSAVLLKEYCDSFLRNDFSEWDSVEKCVNETVGLWALSEAEQIQSQKISSIREEASNAWRKKNYFRVVQLYESILSHLTLSEIKKLEIAKRELGSNNPKLG